MSGNGLTIVKFGFRSSADIALISEALVSAQKKFGAALKDAANPAYRSKYADLSAVIEATLKPLNEQGIAVMQAPQLDGQMVTVTTRLQHVSGQFYESDLSLPAVQRDRFDAQSVGSAITYARRYSWQAITGLATEDDDGNAASGVGSKEAAQEVAQRKLAEHEAKKANGAVPKAQIPTGGLNLPPVPPAAPPVPIESAGEGTEYIHGIIKRVVDKVTKDKRAFKEVGMLDQHDKALTLSSFDNFQLSDGRLWQYLTPSVVGLLGTFTVAAKEKGGKTYYNIINVELLGEHRWDNGVGVMERRREPEYEAQVPGI